MQLINSSYAMVQNENEFAYSGSFVKALLLWGKKWNFF